MRRMVWPHNPQKPTFPHGRVFVIAQVDAARTLRLNRQVQAVRSHYRCVFSLPVDPSFATRRSARSTCSKTSALRVSPVSR